MLATPRRRYDHRVRQAVVATRNVRLFPELDIPVSTARTWLSRGSLRVVGAANVGADDVSALHAEIAMLRGAAKMYLAIASVLLVVIRGFGVDLGATRVADGAEEAKLLRAVKAASRYAPLHRILGLIGLSSSRYHSWKRRKPHAAFNGPTPDEMFFGNMTDSEELAEMRREARKRRVMLNGARSCGLCIGDGLASDSKGVANATA